MTAEEFIERVKAGNRPESYHKSKRDLLREKLAQKVGTSIEDVQIFSIANHRSSSRTIDVRYAVSGSLFYRSAKLNGLVLAYREEVMKLQICKLISLLHHHAPGHKLTRGVVTIPVTVYVLYILY